MLLRGPGDNCGPSPHREFSSQWERGAGHWLSRGLPEQRLGALTRRLPTGHRGPGRDSTNAVRAPGAHVHRDPPPRPVVTKLQKTREDGTCAAEFTALSFLRGPQCRSGLPAALHMRRCPRAGWEASTSRVCAHRHRGSGHTCAGSATGPGRRGGGTDGVCPLVQQDAKQPLSHRSSKKLLSPKPTLQSLGASRRAYPTNIPVPLKRADASAVVGSLSLSSPCSRRTDRRRAPTRPAPQDPGRSLLLRGGCPHRSSHLQLLPG